MMKIGESMGCDLRSSDGNHDDIATTGLGVTRRGQTIKAPQSGFSAHVPDVLVPEPLAVLLLPMHDVLGGR